MLFLLFYGPEAKKGEERLEVEGIEMEWRECLQTTHLTPAHCMEVYTEAAANVS